MPRAAPGRQDDILLAEQHRHALEAREERGGGADESLPRLPSLSMPPPPVPAPPPPDAGAGTRNLAQVWQQIYRDSTVNGAGPLEDFLVSLGSQQIIEGGGNEPGAAKAAPAPARGPPRRAREPPAKLDVAEVPPSPADVRAAQRAARERRANKRKAGGTPRARGGSATPSSATPAGGAGAVDAAPAGEPAPKGRKVKNRESAARSRARRQAYTTELENQVEDLIKENSKLRRRMVEEGKPSPDKHNPRGLRRSRTLS